MVEISLISMYKCQLKQNIILELHTSLLRSHLGFLKTYHRVKKWFFLDGLKYYIQKFVVECLVFQQNKVQKIKTLNMLQPLALLS